MKFKLSVLSLAFFALNAHASAPLRPAAEQQEARAIFKEMIEIKSGYTTGATTPLVEAAVKRLLAAGFTSADIFVGGASPAKANLVVRFRGTGQQKPILLLAHTDVVEAKRDDWSMDPYQFVEKDGYFYGRGTTDDKVQAAVWLANLIAMKKAGYTPNRDIILALTADEEGGGPYNGVDWLLKNHKELIDAEFALNEGGWSEMAHGKKLGNDVQVSEKHVVNYRLEVRNKGGHSSIPVADNAIYRLANALQRLSRFNFPLQVNPVTKAYFAALAQQEKGQLQTELQGAAAGLKADMKAIATISPTWNATLRTTCVATQLQAGHALNALPQLATATINCRVLPDESRDALKATLTKVINDREVQMVEINEFTNGPQSPMNPALFKTITEVSQQFWPGVPTVPMMLMGATDGRYLRAAGIPTYGVEGFFMDRDDIRAHGRDERIEVASFYEGQAFLYELVKKLT